MYHLRNEFDDTTCLLDLLLGESGDESGLDNEWLVESAFTKLYPWSACGLM